MPTEVNGDIEQLQGRAGADSGLTNDAEDITGGVTEDLGNVPAFTLFLKVTESTAVDVTVELSPDGGESWYDPEESPVSVPSNETDRVEHIPYNANKLRLSANNQTPVKAQIREVV